MDQRKARRALKAVEAKYAAWIESTREDGETDPDSFPKIVRSFYRDGDWCIVWEYNSPDEWAIKWGNTEQDPDGIFLEPVYSFVLGVYDA